MTKKFKFPDADIKFMNITSKDEAAMTNPKTEVNMTLDKLIEKYGLDLWISEFNWQGGTIHQVKQEMLSRLNSNGMIEESNGNIVGLQIQEPFTEIIRPVRS